MTIIGRTRALGALALSGLVALTQVAAAQVTAEQQSAIKASCRSDFMSKCSGVRPGGADALQCLQKNVASLSPACQSAVSATLPKPAPAAAAAPPPPVPPPAAAAPAAPPPPAAAAPTIQTAKPPAATMPASKPAAPVKPAAAPPPQQAAVPPPAAPAADMPPPPTAAQMNAIKNTCRGDFNRNCKGVPLGGPEAIACLQRNAARLSPNCKTSLADIADSAPAAAPTAPVTQRPNAPVVMTAVIGRACMRDLIRRCRDTGVGDGQKIACLQANEASLAPLCKAALKGTAPIR